MCTFAVSFFLIDRLEVVQSGIFTCLLVNCFSMEVSVKINADTPVGKRLLKTLRNYPQDVTFESPAVCESPPEGYVTQEEFRKTVLEDTQLFCRKHGIL
jgi:hypothetical protein